MQANVYFVAAWGAGTLKATNGKPNPDIIWKRRRELQSDFSSELERALQTVSQSSTPQASGGTETTKSIGGATATSTGTTTTASGTDGSDKNTTAVTDPVNKVIEPIKLPVFQDTPYLIAARSLLEKVAVIKNKQLDLLCNWIAKEKLESR